MIENTANTAERGQTALGGVYATIFTVIVISAVGTAGFAFIVTPAANPADSTNEASIIAADLVYDSDNGFAAPPRNSATTQAPNVDQSELEDFISNPTAAVDHTQAAENDLSVNVVIEDTSGLGPESVFSGESQVETGDDNPPATAAEYRQPAVLNGERIMVVVQTWPEH